ncbi:MAG TPA: hypothetical protein VKE74_12615 [Gemmataceae bacterium]|nr:hypothetical protein [Gemmataceae bacterium]
MRFVSSLVLYVVFLAAIGCGDRGKGSIKEATAEDIQKQKEAEKQVQAEESAMRKNQPKEKTHEQTVDEQERNRRR